MALGSGYSHLQESIPLNVRAGAWAVVSPTVHLGGIVGYRYERAGVIRIDDQPRYVMHTLLLGGSLRVGTAVAPDVCMGFAMDVGVTLFRDVASFGGTRHDFTNHSAYFFPALMVVSLFPMESMSVGVEFATGFEIMAGGTETVHGGDQSSGRLLLVMGWTAQLGLTFGPGAPRGPSTRRRTCRAGHGGLKRVSAARPA
jgi:hypothetical protein